MDSLEHLWSGPAFGNQKEDSEFELYGSDYHNDSSVEDEDGHQSSPTQHDEYNRVHPAEVAYPPLQQSSTDIRLLRIDEYISGLYKYGRRQCVLEVFALYETPPYVALSYC